MAFNRNNNKSSNEFKHEVLEDYGVISTRGNWDLKLTYTSWNDNEPKYDLRLWDENMDKSKKTSSFTGEEMEALYEVLKKIAEEPDTEPDAETVEEKADKKAEDNPKDKPKDKAQEKAQNKPESVVKEKPVEYNADDLFEQEVLKGSGFAGGKKRIKDFFSEKHTAKEKAEFLKNEYGTGGCNTSDHSAKGLKITVTDKLYKWSEVAKKIDELIEAGKYEA